MSRNLIEGIEKKIQIMDERTIEIPYKFECRDYQIDAWEALLAGKNRIVCCWHRGAGKDLFGLNYFIWRMIKEPAVYLHCFPQYSQAKRAIWNSVHRTDDGESMGYLEHFPKELIKYKNSQEMRIELFNGSIYCVMGIDGKNAQLARGMNPTHVIVSEYAYMSPESWETIEPRVINNKGTVLFLSTPNGKNHFYDVFNYAASGHDPNYFCSIVTNDDTKINSPEDIQRLRDQGRPEDFIQQEFFCDFNRGAQGSYYGNLIQDARKDERICNISINSDLPVCTSWDIGIGDSTAIWFFQQLVNGNIHYLNYYENNNEPLEHYLQYCDDWKAKQRCIYGTHYVPHDMRSREYSSGISRLETAQKLGYNMLPVVTSQGQAFGVEEGINVVRASLPHCIFNEKTCNAGIKCLEFYRKKWNDALKVYYDQPLHDRYSHGADAFRVGSVGLKMFGTSTNKLSADKIREMRQRNYGF